MAPPPECAQVVAELEAKLRALVASLDADAAGSFYDDAAAPAAPVAPKTWKQAPGDAIETATTVLAAAADALEKSSVLGRRGTNRSVARA